MGDIGGIGASLEERMLDAIMPDCCVFGVASLRDERAGNMWMRNLSDEFETALSDRCRGMLLHHEAAVSQLRSELGVQRIRTESERDAAQSQVQALEIALRDQAVRFEASHNHQARTFAQQNASREASLHGVERAMSEGEASAL